MQQVDSAKMVPCKETAKIFLVICSVLSGALFAIVWHHYEKVVQKMTTIHSPMTRTTLKNWFDKLDHREPPPVYDEWLRKQGLSSVSVAREQISYGEIKFRTEAEFLHDKVKVLCLILSTSRSRSKALNQTWTQHCNRVVFYGKYTEKKIPVIKMNLSDDTIFSSKSFCKIFDNFLRRKFQFDWLLISSDKTYALVDNLRHYVAPFDANETWYLGRPVQHYFLGVYNAYDSGIVLSHGSVSLLATLFPDLDHCSKLQSDTLLYSGSFDAYIGMTLSQYGIHPSNTLDSKGRSRFHSFKPEKHMFPELISVFDAYWTSNVMPTKRGIRCCR